MSIYKDIHDELREELMSEIDSGDVFGSVMSLLFDCAEYMHHEGMDIPNEWQFRPGAGVPDMEWNVFYGVSAPEERCLAIGDYLHRAQRICHALGMSY